MDGYAAILAGTRSVLVVDWPSRDVPEAFARAGYEVVVHGGPAPDDYTSWTVENGEVVVRPVGRPPEHADLVYSHRPVDELPAIVETAQAVGARAVWVQSGLAAAGRKDPAGCWMAAEDAARARAVVEAAGLVYVNEPYVAGAVRQITGAGTG